MKAVRNLLVVFGIIIITYGVMINVNRNKYEDFCTTVYVIKNEDEDHILNNSDYMVVDGPSTKDIFNDIIRNSQDGSTYAKLTQSQKDYVDTRRADTEPYNEETYMDFIQHLSDLGPMFNVNQNQNDSRPNIAIRSAQI